MKPKLHCTSLFTTWEFPERALLSNIFPILVYVHNPGAPVGVQSVLLAKKGLPSLRLQQYGLVPLQPGLRLDLLCLPTGSSSDLTTNKEPLVSDGLSRVQVAGGRKRKDLQGLLSLCSHQPQRRNANANNTHLCCLHRWKFSISSLIHLRPLLLTGSFFSHAVQAATVQTQS